MRRAPIRALFVLNNLNIGGPQKGLLGLLEELSLSPEFDCEVVSLQPGGALRPHLEQWVPVRDVSPLVNALQMNKDRVAADLRVLIRQRLWSVALKYMWYVLLAALGRPVNPSRQRLWAAAAKHLGRAELGPFDAAFAVSSGLATYFVADCVQAERRYHWVIGDYSRTPVDRKIDLSYLSRMSGGLAVSEETADIFLDVFPELAARRPVAFRQRIPWKFYAEQREGVSWPESAAKIVSVCRLDPGKGLEVALEAADLLRGQGLAFHWKILGDGEVRADLERDIVDRGLQHCVELTGFRFNVAEHIETADVFVLASLSEGRSVAVDEAVAMGVAVVVTNYRTAASQVEHGVDGLIVEPTPAALAAGITAVVSPAADSGALQVRPRGIIALEPAAAALARLIDAG